MDAELWILIFLMAFCAVLIAAGASAAEKRWNRLHPPNGYDGMREDEDDDDDSE